MYLFESRMIWLVIGGLLQLACLVSSLAKPCPKFDVPYGRTKYRSRGRAIRIICLKGYNLIGERTLLCNKGKWDSDIPVCAKPGCTLPEARIPNGKVLSSYNHQIIRTVCEDGFEMQGSPVIFCNGIVWNDTLPLCLGKPGLKACDFESRDQFCGWYQTRSFVGWQIGHDPLENWVSPWAPDFDHTFGLSSFGHYIFLKARTQLTPYPATGTLKSPVYRKPENPNVCFQFWFHVYGDETAADLRVYVNRELVWSKLQVNRKLWQRGAFHFEVNSTYQIMIEATIPGDTVTLALDDLEVMENCTKITDYVLGMASSCEGRCGDDGYVDDCSCDYGCQDVDNCCPDIAFFCPNIAVDTTVVTETSVLPTQYYNTPTTTEYSLAEQETVPYTSVTESSMDQNNADTQQAVEEVDNVSSSQTTVEANQDDHNKENRNYESDTTRNVVTDEHLNERIDVADKTNETKSEQVTLTPQGKSSESDIASTLSTIDQEKSTQNIDNANSIVQNKTFEIKDTGENEPNQQEDILPNNEKTEGKIYYEIADKNETSSFGFDEGSYQNVRRKVNRIRGSIKKSTVVFEDESDQSNRTQTQSAKTENTSAINGTEKISNLDQDIDSIKMKVNDSQDTTINNVKETKLESGHEFTSDKETSETMPNNTRVQKDTKLNETKAEERKALNSNGDNTNVFTDNTHQNDTADSDKMTVCENSASPINITNNITNENTPNNSSQSNRNITKITLYQNSTAAINNTQHTAAISRVQIQMHAQPNGQPVVENVKINKLGKYNESTIARLKQINAHIINVIAKRNGSNADNTTIADASNNNATVLHKLKHFITSIIDSHNKSSLLSNSTENNERGPESGDVNRNTSLIMNTTYSGNNSDSMYSDGLLILSEKPPTLHSIEKTQTKLAAEESSNSWQNGNNQINVDTRQTETIFKSSNSKSNNLSSVIKPELNMTVINTHSLDRNRTIESLDFKIFDRSSNKTYEGPVKQGSSQNQTSPDEVHPMNNLGRDRDYYSGNIGTFSQEGQISSQAEDFNTSTTQSMNSTSSSQSQSTRKYFPSTVKKYKASASTQEPNVKTIVHNSTIKSKIDEFMRKMNTTFTKLRANQTSINRRRYWSTPRTTTYYSPKWTWRRVYINRNYSTSTIKSTETTKRTIPTERSTEQKVITTPSGTSRYSISLLKNAFGKSDTGFSGDTEQKYRYSTLEQETPNPVKQENIVIQASSSKNDEKGQVPPFSPLSILSFLLVVVSVILSTLASYCLVQRYRRMRGDDPEVEYLTGDELLYFHTPSPHLRPHRSPHSETGDDVRSF